MNFVAGERICARTTCDDGFPIVRYGTVNAVVAANGPLIVVFDDDMGANLVDLSEVEILSITSISRDNCDSIMGDRPCFGKCKGLPHEGHVSVQQIRELIRQHGTPNQETVVH